MCCLEKTLDEEKDEEKTPVFKNYCLLFCSFIFRPPGREKEERNRRPRQPFSSSYFFLENESWRKGRGLFLSSCSEFFFLFFYGFLSLLLSLFSSFTFSENRKDKRSERKVNHKRKGPRRVWACRPCGLFFYLFLSCLLVPPLSRKINKR